ncbi:putative 2-oxoisovalerate dehydrogenase alpha subunit mitochondrial precursor [Russula vinacea]|nr:putative 2-oxoisovalerate dehydrogenase alpha subunit mitochondrial precursor [Russula vinacea]
MIRTIWTRPLFALSRIFRKGLYTTTPVSFPESHGVLPTSQSPITPKPHFFNAVSTDGKQLPTYRIIDGLDEQLARRIYRNMVLLPIMDNLLYNIQRQGKISFYYSVSRIRMSMCGAKLLIGQYRELGVLLWRGWGIDDAMAQCFGNEQDRASKGRQMPVHWAAGVAYALRRDPARRGKNCAAVYFGEGAASEGDFHAGMLFASVISSPTLFIARNNGFAISTPSSEQYFGDGIAARGAGYGVDTIRVDGNDVLAVLSATRDARRRCVESGRGVLLEAMTYRVGHHSTSDDSFAYRARQEVEDRKRIDNPIARYRLFLQNRGWWSDAEEDELKESLKKDVMRAFKHAESLKRHELKEVFSDVYGGEEPLNLKEQREELTRLLRKYGTVWEPWKAEMKKFKDNGESLLGRTE